LFEMSESTGENCYYSATLDFGGKLNSLINWFPFSLWF
jgi:hypothetical protein